MNIDELIALEHQALARFGALLEAAAPERLGDPTPCHDWTVRDLVEHTVGLTAGFAEALGRGDAPPAAYRPLPLTGWADAAAALERAMASSTWEGEVRIAPVCDDLTFARHHAVSIHLLDLAVHDWDLARALGVDHDPDDATVDAVRGMADLVATRPVPSTRDQFAAPVHTRDDEPPGWARVLKRVGRDPAWKPPVGGAAGPALEAVGLTERLARFTHTWSPKIVCRVNDHEVKVVKLLGEFAWHTHVDTDELFAVVTGRMRIEMRHGAVVLGPGDLYVVPRGVEHRPVADVLTEAVLLEPAGVVNTGDVGGALTAVDEALV